MRMPKKTETPCHGRKKRQKKPRVGGSDGMPFLLRRRICVTAVILAFAEAVFVRAICGAAVITVLAEEVSV